MFYSKKIFILIFEFISIIQLFYNWNLNIFASLTLIFFRFYIQILCSVHITRYAQYCVLCISRDVYGVLKYARTNLPRGGSNVIHVRAREDLSMLWCTRAYNDIVQMNDVRVISRRTMRSKVNGPKAVENGRKFGGSHK